MKQQSIFNFSGGLALLVLAAVSAPSIAQGTYSDTPTEPGEQQQYGQPGADQQTPSERQPGLDSSVTPGQPEMQQMPESRARGPRGPIRSERMSNSDKPTAEKGYEGFLQFQERGTSSP